MPTLYSEIERDLAQQIREGKLAKDAPLPTEIELCEIYGVSRITVRRAVERLVSARMIYRRRGIGTFVNQSDSGLKSLRLTGRIQDVLTFDQKLTARVLKRGPEVPPEAVRTAFAIGKRDKLYCIEAVNFLDRKPYAITRSFLAKEFAEIGAKIEMRGGKTSIRTIEELTGVRARSAEQTIEPKSARGHIAKLLGIKPSAPILSATRIYFADSQHPLEAVLVDYHPERYRVYAELVTTDSFLG